MDRRGGRVRRGWRGLVSRDLGRRTWRLFFLLLLWYFGRFYMKKGFLLEKFKIEKKVPKPAAGVGAEFNYIYE